MLLKIVLYVFTLLFSLSANAVVFEAYRDSLENDLLCKNLPPSIEMHKQLLKETGAISGKGKAKGPLISYKIKNGFELFGFPLLEVSLIGNNNNGEVIAIIAAKSSTIVNALQQRGIRLNKLDVNNAIYYNTEINDSYEINVNMLGNNTVIACTHPDRD